MPSRPSDRLDPELDARLVARCLDGDARAWAALVSRYERLVYAVARTYRLSDEDLADVFQEVFAALVKGLPRLRDPRSICRWLSSTTERIAFATTLRRRRERALDAGPVAADLPSEAEPVGADLETLEDQMMVRLALGRLAPRCQRLLAALYFDDPEAGYREVGRALGIPVGSIGPTRARCLEALRQSLAAAGARGGRIKGAVSPTSPTDGEPTRAPRARPDARSEWRRTE